MDNQQKFNEISAEIFSQLYDSFPIGKELNIKDFPDCDPEESSDLFDATVKFYIDENFIRCKKQYRGMQLTPVTPTCCGFRLELGTRF